MSTARRLKCHVTVGYPEKTAPQAPTESTPVRRFNSAVTVSPDGTILANYRKSFLYSTDESWAEEGDAGFFSGELGTLGKAVMGICMDLNPYQDLAPWTKYEFANHALSPPSPLIIVSMAWLTRLEPSALTSEPTAPDMDTFSYWLSRLQPLVDAKSDQEVVVVFGNRCGQEGPVCFAGTSAVLGIKAGEIKVYDILGRDEEGILIVDTTEVL
ncbi:MAG: hypothetical protein M1819_007191 [Sarea resinae]|nr:MAG: hypothetical protein M1819_007191 [Sarea resinae]